MKEKKCLPLLVNEDILGLRRNFLFCVSWLINPDWSKAMTFILMMYFTVWVVVCVIPACCFFLWMSQWKDFCLHILTKKGKNRLFLFFHQHTSCLLCLHCQLDWQDWLSLYCSYLYQFPESSHHLWTIFYIIENRLAFIHRWSLDIVDLQRLDWIWCSSFTTFHLTSGKEISSLFKGETSSGSLVTHSVDLSEDLKFISSLY